MMWDYWICVYTQTHCVARGLRPLTIKAYRSTLGQFRSYVQVRLDDLSPDRITACHVLEYLEHLRRERDNGDSAVNRQATVLRNFYRAIVAMGHLEPSANPMAHFPRIKASSRKLPRVLSHDQVRRLLSQPGTDTVLGLRDRALLAVLYGTGIRASECASMTESDVDLEEATIRVSGKGGHERTLPLNGSVADAMRVYRAARGPVASSHAFFQSRSKRGLSRNAIYERVRNHAARARVGQRVSPHRLRHTFATHLVQRGVGIVTIRDLLGHRLITSTQIYLHVTADELRDAADRHPILQLADPVKHLLPDVKLPFQPPPGRRRGIG